MIQVSATPGITILDFTATWCGPCKSLEPILMSLSNEYLGRVQVVAIDVEGDPVLAERFAVRSMPTLVLLRDGREVGRVVGTRPRTYLAGMIDRALAGDVAIAGP